MIRQFANSDAATIKPTSANKKQQPRKQTELNCHMPKMIKFPNIAGEMIMKILTIME
jgi:hypothetical protein